MTETQQAAILAALKAVTELEWYSTSAVADKIAREAKSLLKGVLDECSAGTKEPTLTHDIAVSTCTQPVQTGSEG